MRTALAAHSGPCGALRTPGARRTPRRPTSSMGYDVAVRTPRRRAPCRPDQVGHAVGLECAGFFTINKPDSGCWPGAGTTSPPISERLGSRGKVDAYAGTVLRAHADERRRRVVHGRSRVAQPRAGDAAPVPLVSRAPFSSSLYWGGTRGAFFPVELKAARADCERSSHDAGRRKEEQRGRRGGPGRRLALDEGSGRELCHRSTFWRPLSGTALPKG